MYQVFQSPPVNFSAPIYLTPFIISKMNYHTLTFYSDGFAPVFPLLILLLKRDISMVGKSSVIGFLITAMVGFTTADFLGGTTGNNLYVYNLLPVLFSIPLFLFFRKVLNDNYTSRMNVYAFIGLAIFYSSGYKTVFDNQYFNTSFYIAFSINFCFSCFLFYAEQLIEVGENRIWKSNGFWFVTCLLFYTGTSTIIWLLLKPVMDKAVKYNLSNVEINYPGDLWKLHHLVFWISCITLAVALLRKK